MNENLHYLVRNYFDPDYDLEAEEPLGVVRVFMNEVTDERVWGLRREIVRLLAEPATDAELEHLWFVDGRASYDPRMDGLSVRQWLDAVVRVLDGR